MKKNWMLYGANGYTGRLILEKAIAAGECPIIAGRNKTEIEALAKQYRLDFRIFPCDRPESIQPNLKGIALVLHAAGPFSATASPMVKACMAAGSHYLDITGEIAVFEKILTRSSAIAKAGIVAIPGVGFDVVPSDCLAAMLKKKLPDATELELILKPSGGFSPGTLKTMIEGFYVGTVVRKNGKIQLSDDFETTRRQFQGKEFPVVGIAWGDVASAFYSTDIPNIRVFLISSTKNMQFLQQIQKLRAVWKLGFMQTILKKIVDWGMQGPDAKARNQGGYKIWGTVKNARGQTAELGIATANGYTFTVDAALAAVAKILKNPPKPGAYTPSLAFGSDFVKKLPDVEILKL